MQEQLCNLEGLVDIAPNQSKVMKSEIDIKYN